MKAERLSHKCLTGGVAQSLAEFYLMVDGLNAGRFILVVSMNLFNGEMLAFTFRDELYEE